jgi:hypothetical protein
MLADELVPGVAELRFGLVISGDDPTVVVDDENAVRRGFTDLAEEV